MAKTKTKAPKSKLVVKLGMPQIGKNVRKGENEFGLLPGEARVRAPSRKRKTGKVVKVK